MENLKSKIEKLMLEYRMCAEIKDNNLSNYHSGKADGLQMVVWEIDRILKKEEIGQEDVMGEGLPW